MLLFKSKGLKALNQIATLETGDGPEITVVDILPEQVELIEKELKAFDLLKPRIKLKESTVNVDGVNFKVVFIEASGFVFQNSEEHKLLQETLKSEEEYNLLKEVLK